MELAQPCAVAEPTPTKSGVGAPSPTPGAAVAVAPDDSLAGFEVGVMGCASTRELPPELARPCILAEPTTVGPGARAPSPTPGTVVAATSDTTFARYRVGAPLRAQSVHARPPTPGATTVSATEFTATGSGMGVPLRPPSTHATPPEADTTVHAPTGPKSIAVLPVPAMDARMEDESLVIVEDVLEDEDEEEDVARLCKSLSSSLSVHASPFFPNCQLAGRNKFRRWEEDLSMGSSDDGLTSPATCMSYRDATRKALWVMPPPPTGAPDTVQSIAAVEETRLACLQGRAGIIGTGRVCLMDSAAGLRHCMPRRYL